MGVGSASPASPRANVKSTRRARHLPAVGGMTTPPLSLPNPTANHASRGRRHHSRAHGGGVEGNVCYACGRWRNEVWDSCGGGSASGGGAGAGGGGGGSRKGKRSPRLKTTSAANLVSCATQTTSLMEALAEAAALGTDATQCIKQLLVPLLCDPGQCRLCECEVVQRQSADTDHKKPAAKPVPKSPDKAPAGDASASQCTSSQGSKDKGSKLHTAIADRAPEDQEDLPPEQSPLAAALSSSQLPPPPPPPPEHRSHHHHHRGTAKALTKYTTCPLTKLRASLDENCSSNDGDASSNNRLTSPSTTCHDTLKEPQARTNRREATFVVGEDRIAPCRSRGRDESIQRGGDVGYAARRPKAPPPSVERTRQKKALREGSAGSGSSAQGRSRERGDRRTRDYGGRVKRGRTTTPTTRLHDEQILGHFSSDNLRPQRGGDVCTNRDPVAPIGPRRRRERSDLVTRRFHDTFQSLRAPSGSAIRLSRDRFPRPRTPLASFRDLPRPNRHGGCRSGTRLLQRAKLHHRGSVESTRAAPLSATKLHGDASRTKLDATRSIEGRTERSTTRHKAAAAATREISPAVAAHETTTLRDGHRHRHASQTGDERRGAVHKRDAVAPPTTQTLPPQVSKGARRDSGEQQPVERRSCESLCVRGSVVRSLYAAPAPAPTPTPAPATPLRSVRDASAPPAASHHPVPVPSSSLRSRLPAIYPCAPCKEKPAGLTSSLDMSDHTLSFASALSVSTSTPLRTSSSREMLLMNLSPPESLSEAHPKDKEYAKRYSKRVRSASGDSSSAKDTSSVLSMESGSACTHSSTDDVALRSHSIASSYDQGDAAAALRSTTEKGCMTALKTPPKRRPPWRLHKHLGRKGFPTPPPLPRRSPVVKGRHSQPPSRSTSLSQSHSVAPTPTASQIPSKGKACQTSATSTPQLPQPPPSPNTSRSTTWRSTDAQPGFLTQRRLFGTTLTSKMRNDLTTLTMSPGTRDSHRVSRKRSRTGSRIGSPRTYSLNRVGAAETTALNTALRRRQVSTPPPSRDRRLSISESSSSDSEGSRAGRCLMVPSLSPVFPPYPCPFVQNTSHGYVGTHLPTGAIFPQQIPVPFVLPTEDPFSATFPLPFPRHRLPETFLKTQYGGFVWETPPHTTTALSQDESEDEAGGTVPGKKLTHEKINKCTDAGTSMEKDDKKGRKERGDDAAQSRKHSRTREELAKEFGSEEETDLNVFLTSVDSGHRIVAESSSSNSSGWGPTSSSVSDHNSEQGSVRNPLFSPSNNPKTTPKPTPPPSVPAHTPTQPPSEPQPSAALPSSSADPPTPAPPPNPTSLPSPPPSSQPPPAPAAPPSPVAASRSGAPPIPTPATAPVRSFQRDNSRTNNRKRFRGCLTPAAMAAAATRAAAAAGQTRRKSKEPEDTSNNRWQR